MNAKVAFLIFILPLAVIAAVFTGGEKEQIEKKYDKLLEDINTETAIKTTDEVADLLVKEDPSVMLIDVRSKDDYDKWHLKGAKNIPLNNLYSEESLDNFGLLGVNYILYSNGTVDAQSAWIMLRLKDFKNIFVMQGGANHWYETILKPVPPANVEDDEEVAKYDFRKAASQYFTGSKVKEDDVATPTPPVKIKRKTEKKRASGGC